MTALDFSSRDASNDCCKTSSSKSKRFIDYVLSQSSGSKMSAQTVRFDTLTKRAVFASDLFFTPLEMKNW